MVRRSPVFAALRAASLLASLSVVASLSGVAQAQQGAAPQGMAAQEPAAPAPVTPKTTIETSQFRRLALMARYFQYEDEVTDELMLSFLRHYSGKQVLDMEDPASVRQEIKAVLDKSSERPPVVLPRRGYAAAALLLIILSSGWGVMHRKITRDEQAELKTLVHELDALDPTMTSAAIWHSVKDPLQIRRYEDMTWWDYWRSRGALQQKLAQLRRG